MRGIVRAHVDDDGGTTFQYRVERRGHLVRCTSLDGRVHVIAGHDTIWRRRDGAPGLHSEPRRHHVTAPDDYEFGLDRPDRDRWDGDDFTRPTGPPSKVTFLGRAALEIDLAPPQHKPAPMQIVIDAETGLLLREGSAAFGTFHEWTSLDTAANLPDELFTLTANDQAATRYE